MRHALSAMARAMRRITPPAASSKATMIAPIESAFARSVRSADVEAMIAAAWAHRDA